MSSRSFRLLTLCLTLASAGALRAATQLITIDGGSLYYVGNACPGQQITVFMTLTNSDVTNAADGRVEATFESIATHPSCTTINTTSESDKWWVIGAGPGANASGVYTTPPNTYPGSYDPGYKSNPGGTWGSRTLSFVVTIPAAAVAGAVYHMNVVVGNYNLSPGSAPSGPAPAGDGGTDRACLTVPLTCAPPAPSCWAEKRVEGTLNNGQIMVYWIDYNFFNTNSIVVTDTIPACMQIIGAGTPPGGSVSIVGQNITWNLGSANSASNFSKKGTLWVHVKAGSGPGGACTPGGQQCNQASYSTADCGSTPTNNLCQTEGSVNLILSKAQYDVNMVNLPNGTTVPTGSTVNYVLSYNLSGDVLRCFDSFSNYTIGNYNPPALGGGLPAGGWSSAPGSSTTAQWNVTDSSPTGDKFLRFLPNNYPSSGTDYETLLYNCPASQPGGEDTCLSEIVADVKHNQPGDNKADVGIWLRNDSQACPMGYMLILTGDLNTGVATAGHLSLQKNNGTCGAGCCTWPADSGDGATNQALDGIWYTIKAVEIAPGQIRAKFWERGTPEPAGWSLVYNDPSPLPGCATVNGSVGDGHVWRPGLGGQGSENHYDNFHVFSVASVTGAAVWDTIPGGIDYGGTLNTPTTGPNPVAGGASEGRVRWDFSANQFGADGSGNLYAGSGSFTWFGVTDCADNVNPAVNTASIGANGVPVKNSNTTTLNIMCGTPTFTPTRTNTPSDTPTPTATATRTVTLTNTPTPTPTDTRTATPTSTDTPSFTITPSPSPTYTGTPSRTATPTYTITVVTATSTITPSRTATPTFTITVVTFTSTITPSRTVTPTFTATITISFSPTDTPSRTVTPTFTATATDTPTQSPGPSATDTDTPSATSTATPTRTITLTRTPTPSPTPTATDTPTQSPGPSATNTATPTDSSTATPTYSVTLTRTPSPTATPTATDTSTQSPGPSATNTDTPTDTFTDTPTYSITLTRTPTPTDTDTRTASPTYTESPAASPSDTPTLTDTATDTATRTITVTSTSTSTRTDTSTATPTYTQSVTRTDTRTITVTFTQTLSPTFSPTPVAMPHTVIIAAYNAAGERVRILYSGAAQYQIGDLKLSAPVFVGSAGQLTIGFPGILADGSTTVAWMGDNDSGTMVGGGMYTIKAEIIDNFGQITSLIQQVQVVPGGAQQTLNIYNSAGELVRTLRLPTPVAGANNLRLDDASYALQIDPSTGKATQALKIDVLGNSGYTSEGWDGLNEQGVPVNGGVYTVQLVTHEGSKDIVVSSRSVTVIKGPDTFDPTESAFAAPNPVLPGNPDIAIYYDPSKMMGAAAGCRMYNLAGELVAQGDDYAGTGRIVLSETRSLASGSYLARFEARIGGAVVKARLIKVAVVR